VPRRFKVIVCRGPDCGERRHSADVHRAFTEAIRTAALGGNEAQLDWHSCFGQCQKGVNVLVREVQPGENAFMISMMPTSAPGACLYHEVKPTEARRILEEHIGAGQRIEEFVRRGNK
jgi:(2Fe-2S) ferredoxin